MIEANLNDKTYCQMDKESVLVQNYNGKLTDSETGYDSSWDSDLGGPVSDENSDIRFQVLAGNAHQRCLCQLNIQTRP